MGKLKKYIFKVEVTADEDVERNDAVGGLCDIIREGLNNGCYDYLADIKVKD